MILGIPLMRFLLQSIHQTSSCPFPERKPKTKVFTLKKTLRFALGLTLQGSSITKETKTVSRKKQKPEQQQQQQQQKQHQKKNKRKTPISRNFFFSVASVNGVNDTRTFDPSSVLFFFLINSSGLNKKLFVDIHSTS